MDALEQLNLAAPIVDIYLEVESAIINHIARQLTANPDTMINATSEWRILMLARMGRLNKDTARIISSKVKKVPDKVQNVVNNAIDNILTEYGLEMTDKLSGNIFKALENYDRQAVKDKYNQVNTVMQYKAKQIYRNSVNAVADRFERMMQEKLENSQEYLDVLNKQALAVTLGETSRTQALRETITEMSEKGIPAFVDASGREWSPEAYVNMDIRNTAKNAALAAEFASLDELGQDIILVSAHAGARPRCYPFQGKFYSRSGKSGTIKDARGREYKFEPFDKTSFGEAAGLFGINCGHRMRGVSDGTFINREEHYSEKENSEEYEKVCKQRQMERRIRADKRTQEALEAAGDTEGAKAVKKRVSAENKALRAYCDKEGLTYRQDRTQIYGYSDSNRKKKPVNFVETVDKSRESGIIKETSNKPITKITDNAIKKVENENISGYNEKQCSLIQKLHKELLVYSREENDNKEVAFVLDGLFSNKKPFIGSDDSLDFGEPLYGNDLFVMHNHPRNSSFSTTDIIFFWKNSNVKTLSIVKNNGNIEYITKSDNYNPDLLKLEYDRLYTKKVKQDTDAEKEKMIRILLTKTRSGVIWSGR